MLFVCARVCACVVLLASFNAQAQSGPHALNISGGLFDANGQPVQRSGIGFKLEVRDKTGSCVLYSETHNGEDLTSTKGQFSLLLGAGASAQNFLAGGTQLDASVFLNRGATGTFTGCPAGVTLASGDERVIRVYYDLGGGLTAMTPDVPIVSSAYAMVADSLQGKGAADFIQVKDDGSTAALNQANTEYAFSFTNWPKLKSLIDGTSSAYLPMGGTAPFDFNNQRLIRVANPGTSPFDATNKGYVDSNIGGRTADFTGVGPAVGDGKTMVWDQAAQKWVVGNPTITGTAGGDLSGSYPNPVIAASAVTTAKVADNAITSNKINTTGVAVNRLVATDATTGSTLTYFTCGVGEIMWWTATGWQCTTVAALAPVKTVAGKTPNASGDVPLNAADISGLGTVVTKDFGSTSGQVPLLDATNHIPAYMLPAGTGTITAVTAVSPVLGGGTSGNVTISLDVGTAANQVVRLNGSAQLPAVDGSLLTGVNATKIGTRAVSSAAPGAAQVLAFNATSSQWEPMSAAVGSVTSVVSGTGLVAGTITSSGTINVDVGTTAGKIVQFDGSARYPANDGSQITNVNATKIGTRAVATTAPTGSQVLGYNATSSQWEPMTDGGGTVVSVVSGTGLVAGTITTNGTLNVDVGTAAGKIVQLNGSAAFPAIDAGNLYNVNASKIGTRAVASTAPAGSQVLGFNASLSQWEPMSAAVGSVTSVVSGTGLVAGSITSSGTINVDVGTGANKIVQLNGSGAFAAIDGGNLYNVNASKIGTRAVASNSPSASQVLMWNGSLSQWEPANASSTLSWPLTATPGTTPASAPSYSFSGSPSTGLFSQASNSVAVATAGTARLTIDASGNVGIGTTSPVAPLDVVGNINASGVNYNFYGNDTSQFLTLGNNSSTAKRRAAMILFNYDGTGFGGAPELDLRQSRGNVSSPTATQPGDVLGVINWQGNRGGGVTTPAAMSAVATEVQTVGGNGGALALSTTPNGSTTLTERLRVDQNGNVGIGTSAPQAGLDVAATGTNSALVVPRDIQANRPAANAANGMIRYNTSTNKFEGYENGTWVNMTAAGAGSGDFKSDGSVAMTAALRAYGGTPGAPGYAFVGDTDTGVLSQTANTLEFATGGTSRMTISPSGYVGIGVASPAVPLEVGNNAFVSGNDYSTSFVVGNKSSTGAQYPNSIVLNYAGTSAGYPAMFVKNSRGAQGAAVALNSGDVLGAYVGQGNTGGAWSSGASMQFNASENFAPGATGTEIRWYTTKNGTNSVAERMRLANDGNLGIGTTAPLAALDVATTGTNSALVLPRDTQANRPSTNVANGMIRYNTSTSKFEAYENGVWTNMIGGAAGSLAFNTLTAATGTNALDNANFGQVWNWSTASTQNPLSLNANGLTTGSLLSLQSNNAGLNSTNGLLNVANTGTSTSGLVARVQANSTAGSGLYVLANGNVGIGMSSPTAALQVAGTTTTNGLYSAGPVSANTYDTTAYSSSGSLPYALLYTQNTANQTASTAFHASSARSGAGTAQWSYFGVVSTSSGYTPATVFGYSTSASGYAETMRIDASGNLGIGTTSPKGGLDVAISGTNSALVLPRDTTANRPAGNVANGMIRYNTSTSKFEAYENGVWTNMIGGAAGSLAFNTLTAATGTSALDNGNFGQVWNWTTASTQNPLSLNANGLTSGSLLAIQSNNAGLNSTNGLLNVANTGTSTSGLVARVQANSTAGSGLTVLANGNVGVGTIAPTDKLQVNGNLQITGAGSVLRIDDAQAGGGQRWAITGYGQQLQFNKLAADWSYSAVGMVLDSSGKLGIGNSIPQAALDVAITGTNSAIVVPRDSTGARPAANAANGMIRYNTSTSKFEAYENGVWTNMIGGAAGSLAFNTLTAATGTNALDNANFGQVWNWSTASTQNPLTLNANGLTTGSLLSLNTNNAGLNSTAGLLNVANTGTSTSGTVARIQANSTAGSGLTVQANGYVGIGTSNPFALLDMSSSFNSGNGLLRLNVNDTGAFAPGTPNYTLQAINTAGAGHSTIGLVVGTGGNIARTAIVATRPSANTGGVTFYSDIAGTLTPQMAISNGNVAIGGTSALAALDVAVTGTNSALVLPRDTTANRPATNVANGMLRYNTNTNKFEAYENGAWTNMIAAGGGTTAFPLLANPGTTPSSAPSYSFTGSTNTGLYSQAANSVALATAGTARLTVNASGIVGIGITNPTLGVLHVAGVANFDGSVQARDPVNSLGSNLNALFRFKDYNNVDAGLIGYNTQRNLQITNYDTTGAMIFGTNGTARMNIDASGKVGIGLTNQAAPLTVQSDNPARGGVMITTSSTGQFTNLMFAESGGAGRALIQKDTNNHLQLWTGTGAAGSESWFNRMDIDPAGNVGIGTNSPQSALDIGLSGTSSAIIVPRDTTANRPATNVANGMIRYNTNTNKFEAYENGAWSNMIAAGGGTTAFPLLASPGTTPTSAPSYSFSGSANTGVHSPAVGKIALVTNGTSGLVQDVNGWVGINTPSPAAQLHVTGATQIDGVFTNYDFENVTYGTISASSATPTMAQVEVVNTATLANSAAGFTMAARNAGGYSYGYVATLAPASGASSSVVIGASTASNAYAERLRIDGAGRVGIGTSAPLALLDLSTTGTNSALVIPRDTTANRPSTNVANGMIRYNTSTSKFEAYENGVWANMIGGPAASLAFNTLTAATGTGALDNGNYGQVWNWSTANTQNPLSLNANGLTTGSLLSLQSSNAGLNSTNGLLNVANTGTSTSGVVARVQANSTAGSGLYVLANGNVGVGTAAPGALLDVNGGGASTRSRLLSGGSSSDFAFRIGRTAEEGTLAIAGVATQWASNSAPGDLIVRTESGKMIFDTNFGSGTPAMTIFGGNGKIGMGTISPSAALDIGVTGTNSALVVPRDTTANRPAANVANGMLRYNTNTNKFEAYENGAWTNMIATGGGTTSFPLLATVNGTASAPAYSFSGSGSNDGMYLSGADEISFSAGGAQRLAIGTYYANLGVDLSFPDNNGTIWGNDAWLTANGGAGSHYLTLATGVTERMRIAANGNVGIGATGAGSAALEIVGTSSLNSALIIPRATTAARPGTAANGMIRYNTSTSKFEAYENGAWTNMIAAGGGTASFPLLASPAITTASAPSYSFSGDTDTGMYSTAANNLVFASGGTARVSLDQTGLINMWGQARIWSYSGDSNLGFATNGSVGLMNSGAWQGMTFANASTENVNIVSQGSAPIQLATWGTTRMTILPSNGYVGIGTGSPANRLSVVAPTGTSYVDATANGSGAAGFLAQTYGGTNTYNGFFAGGAASGSRQKYLGNFNGTFTIGKSDDSWSTNVDQFAILTNGNVGVGTVTPKAILDLTATGTNSALIVPRDTQANRPAGNVANGMIRYNTDTAKFEAYENGAWSNLISAAGSGASSINGLSDGYLNSTSKTTYLGYKPGGIGATDTNNTVVGQIAMGGLNNSGATYNSVVGASAMGSNTSGSRNSVLGASALAYGASNSDNVAIGYVAASGNWSSASVNQSVFVGTQAGSGNANTLLATSSIIEGYLAGSVGSSSNLTLYDTTAIGAKALSTSSGSVYGTSSIVIGKSATSTSGAVSYTNSVILGNGFGAPSAAQTVANTVSLGHGAGAAITTGSNNMFLGYQAGAAITTGSNNLLLGYAATAPSATSSNFLNIGNAIYGDLSSKNIGVGTVAPVAVLDVSATGTNSALVVPRDTTANRPAGNVANGMLRYNTNTNKFEVYENGAWTNMIAAGGGTTAFPLLASPATTTAGAPSYSFTGNANTGMYSPATNQIGFSVAGTNMMNVTTSGVGINVTPSASRYLDVATSVQRIYVDNLGMTADGGPGASPGTFFATGDSLVAGNQIGQLVFVDRVLRPNITYGPGILAKSTEAATATKAGTSLSLITTPNGTTTTATRLFINHDGTVGVGTTTPSAILDVAATGTNSALVVPRDTTANRPAGNVANGMIRYNTSTAKFEAYEAGAWTNMIGGGAATFPLLASPGTTPSSAPSYSFTGSTNTGLFSQSVGTLALATKGTTALTVDGSGFVGIGTATPYYNLQVVNRSGDSTMMVGPTASGSSNATLGLTGINGGSPAVAAIMQADWNGNLLLRPGPNNGSIDLQNGLAASQVYLDGSSRVGVGTTSPKAALDIGVTGTNSALVLPRDTTASRPAANVANGMLRYNTSTNKFEAYENGAWTNMISGGSNLWSTGTSGQIYYSSGNVGIGTSSPSSALEVRGGAASGPGVAMTLSSPVDNAVAAVSYILKTSNKSVDVSLGPPNGNGNLTNKFYLNDNVGGVRWVTDITNGNFGIGTLTPQSKLDVSGGAAIGSYAGSNAAPTNGLIVSGTAGFGTQSPSYALHVVGTTGFGTTVTGQIQNTNTAGNAAVGAQSDALGIRLEAGGSTGVNGALAMIAANSFIPIPMVFNINNNEFMRISGTGLVGIGTTSPQAGLDVATTGTGKSAIIVPRDTTANRPSVAVNGMLRYNSSTSKFEAYENGAWANMIGGGSGGTPGQLGNENTAIGYSTMPSVTGNSNSAFGSRSLGAVSSGYDNVAVGRNALTNLTTSGGNVALGRDAGVNLTTGANNVLIGYGAGYNTLTTGSNNIVIGASNGYGTVDVPTASTSNFMNLGNIIFATGMNGTLASPAGNVGIGTASPGSKLTVYDSTTNAGITPLTVAAYTGAGPGKYVNIAIDNQTSGAWKAAFGFRNNGADKYSIGVDYQGNGTNNLSFFDNVAASTRMLIDQNGNVGIGTTSPSTALEVNGTIKAVDLVLTSDRTLKTNIRPSEGLARLLRLQGVQFDWIKSGQHEHGVIAQDVEEVFPDAVVTDPNTGLKAVKYTSLISPLIESVKEIHGLCEMSREQLASHDRRISSLEQENAALKKKNEDLERRLEAIERALEKMNAH